MNPRALLVLALLVALIGVGYGAARRFEGTPPSVLAPERVVVGQAGTTLTIELEDTGSGLREINARLLHQAGSRPISEQQWPGGLLEGGAPDGRTASVELTLDPGPLQLPDGTATLVISVRDWSWRDGFAGNRTELSIPVVIDTRPPRVALASGLTYVYRGGSGAAVYRAAPDAVVHGVRVGDSFFPGHPHPLDNGAQVALFAIPVDADADPLVEIVGVDAAGNEGRVRFPARLIERKFSHSEIAIDDAFIQRVAAPLAREAGLPAGDDAEIFRSVNEVLRGRNEQSIRDQLQTSQDQALWQGAFLQLPGSSVMSRFAEYRTYLLAGRPISEARHFGFDLASTSGAPVIAANTGTVLFAGDLGIYGQCVIIDHGLGLSTLYGHLSMLDVSSGQQVERGQVLGRTGATGLAGGDHLHFAILVSGVYVDPLEWWDGKWVRSHVTVRLEQSPD